MRRLGFVIFLAGIVLASWYAARPITEATIEPSSEGGAVTSLDRLVAWGHAAGVPFSIGVLLIVGGGIVARRSERTLPRTDDGTDRVTDVRVLLRELDQAVTGLPVTDPRECAQQLHRELDRILEELIPAFLDEREQHVAQLGLSRYARMSSAFASAERALARAWSALTDEAWAEVPSCLDAARISMAQAVGLSGDTATGTGSNPQLS